MLEVSLGQFTLDGMTARSNPDGCIGPDEAGERTGECGHKPTFSSGRQQQLFIRVENPQVTKRAYQGIDHVVIALLTRHRSMNCSAATLAFR